MWKYPFFLEKDTLRIPQEINKYMHYGGSRLRMVVSYHDFLTELKVYILSTE